MAGEQRDDVSGLTTDELVAAVAEYERQRSARRERAGRMLAELYRRGGLSWPKIARVTGMRQTTAYDMAQPYLTAEHGDERP